MTPRKNTQYSNALLYNLEDSNRWAYGPTLAKAGAMLFGLMLSGLFTSSNAQTVSSWQAEHPGWVQAPGHLISSDCVHEIPNGAKVEISGGQITGDVTLNGALVAHYDPCTEPAIDTRHVGQTDGVESASGNGLIEESVWDASLKSSDNIDVLEGNLTVPSKPYENGALIYLYNGVVPSTENAIVESVLQYGNNGSFGGNYWTISSWVIGPNNVFHSPGETVNPGDTLFLYDDIYGESGDVQNFRAEAQDLTTGAYSYVLESAEGFHWTWAVAGAMEGYGVTSCSEFPANGKAVFSNTKVGHDFPNYIALSPKFFGAVFSYGGPVCGFKVAPGTKTTLSF